MVHLQYLILRVPLLCLCVMETLSSKNVLKFKMEKPKTLEKTVYKIMVDMSSSDQRTDVRFLSVALGSQRVNNMDWSDKLISLASELSPCELRLGGTSADFFKFDPNGIEYQLDVKREDPGWNELDPNYTFPTKDYVNYTVSGKRWDAFINFTTLAGWDLLFDVNLFFWRSDGLWDSTNAELLLNYSAARGVLIPYFQLGNEPNAFWGNFKFRISPETLLEDYKILINLTKKFPLYSSSKFCGPDVTNVKIGGGARVYFKGYYCDGETAKLEDFLSVVTLDSLREKLEQPLLISNTAPRPLPIRLTETSSCYGGGAPGLSDRYIAGFLWLDKLGLCAQYGVTRVFRQTFFGASYALVTYKINPTPDYFLSVLFKRLIEGPVFNVSIDPPNKNLRVYAHCTRQGVHPAGALTVYYLNLDDSDIVLSLTQFQSAKLLLYLLTPGDGDGLRSSYVKLNGNILLMPEMTLPEMPPKSHEGDITVTAHSFGFIVVEQAQIGKCPKCADKFK